MAIINQEALNNRADELDDHGLNGMKLILVKDLETTTSQTQAHLQVYFFNNQSLVDIVAAFNPDTEEGREVLTISGGHRLPAGWDTGQVQVTEAEVNSEDDKILDLTVTPIGDYSTYTLHLQHSNLDPIFSQIPFKFRPGCFNINCAPGWEPAPEPKQAPLIDYLAKDYDSFKHTMITAMMERVPGWQVTSEADLDQVLIDLFSAAGDELSDFQDRVMNEAYLGTARKRVSMARHARLMDYHIHQGNQASTWLALELNDDEQLNLPDNFAVWTGDQTKSASSKVFLSSESRCLLASISLDFLSELDAADFSLDLKEELEDKGITTSDSNVEIIVEDTVEETEEETEEEAEEETGRRWIINDIDMGKKYFVREEEGQLNVYAAHMHYLLNRMGLYTWEDSIPALKAGSVTADLQVTPDCNQANAEAVRDMIREGKVKYLLIQEALNPATGKPGGTDPGKRQLLKLITGDKGAEALEDPMNNKWFVRVRWEEKDKLKHNYCFTVDCPEGKKENISFFNGNLVEVFHGEPVNITFKEPGERLEENEYTYEQTEKWGTICRLPHGPLAYKNTPPGGEIPPRSTLEVTVEVDEVSDPWEEVSSLVHSDNSAESGDHFVVETDEQAKSLIRFGNDINGRKLPEKASVHCWYQMGTGLDGNIGADTLINYDNTLFPGIKTTWNPFDVINGRAPEPEEEILRRAPRAYRARQLRAVTLRDYVNRAEELEEVARAAARYAWTGSWRTVRVTIDPAGTTQLEPEVKEKVARHLEAVRLIGEDLEIRPPRFVPLEITVILCIHHQYWRDDIEYILEQEFSQGYLPNGRTGFFHPDNWTFGQPLRTSQIIGRVQSVKGVDHVISVFMKRWNESTPGTGDMIEVGPNEIIRVRNHPDHMEEGSITFDVRGGRQ
jgi:hypothetical protein